MPVKNVKKYANQNASPIMKRYIHSLNSLLKKYNNYRIEVRTGNNISFSAPNSGNLTNLRLIRKNNKANLVLHKKMNGVSIAWGSTKQANQGQRLGTKIRALAALAALKANLPLYQWAIYGKNSGSYKIMKKLGAKNNNNSGMHHFKFVPGQHNLNNLNRFIST